MIFKGVREGKPYPEHGLSYKDWSRIPPQQIRLDELVTTTRVLELDRLLSEDSTFYGDLFPHAVKWRGIIYLDDGLHRAVRAALRNRVVLHARVHDMDMATGGPSTQQRSQSTQQRDQPHATPVTRGPSSSPPLGRPPSSDS